ncbi:hypothetical protein CEE37_10735 [candidate division LCP-89 bacterium B3_LCP]|uniref:4-alpha-glucanotransferase n=1 Tax=candidate division LCP-89 bacterium B3_LCP TaxID=2012998 RepID=A0A532UXT8_UNCL8|nr:MAG: hypothetical protein CEE37_10735 [candidate division LCP-89 bacterium B3_LCP]
MKSINFILGVHNHQPVGNFDFVFEEAYLKSYLPFLDVLEEHPSLKLMYHTTGPLWDWLESTHPDFIDRIKKLAKDGQIELMTGGYYEPILAVLPDLDKAGQIDMMSQYIEKRLDVNPKGLWLAERIWEPHLAKSLAECGVEFITLDDYHFLSAGKRSEDLTGYYLTEEQGNSLAIFPIDMQLRYLLPFSKAEEAIAHLKNETDESGNKLLVMCDDGEKFGMWPGTYDWVYEKGWLSKFFTLLEDAISAGWLKMTTCSDFKADNPPQGRIYLPCASYFEMSEWSLPAQSSAQFTRIVHQFKDEGRMDEMSPYLKGGFWRNFLGKYEESNRMHRKALWISTKIAELSAKRGKQKAGRKKKLEEAKRHLYRAQCNCAYWHGVFGGLYLPHLRHAVYANLIGAETICDQLTYGNDEFVEINGSDFDGDGTLEIMLKNKRIGMLISPAKGGAIYSLDYFPARYNLLNTLHRQPEGYHEQVVDAGNEIEEGASIHDQVRSKEDGLERFLIYDKHLRDSLIDHFLSENESPDSLKEGTYHELGSFVNSQYNAQTEPVGEAQRIILTREDRVVDNLVEVQKTISFTDDGSGLLLGYRISNNSDFPLNIIFTPEFNFAMLAGDSPDRYYLGGIKDKKLPLKTTGITSKTSRFSLFNEADKFSINFNFNSPTEVWRYPVETVSQSEGGFERVYQSSCVLPVFRLDVPKRGKFETEFKLIIEALD